MKLKLDPEVRVSEILSHLESDIDSERVYESQRESDESVTDEGG